jgi:hypothetical protein
MPYSTCRESYQFLEVEWPDLRDSFEQFRASCSRLGAWPPFRQSTDMLSVGSVVRMLWEGVEDQGCGSMLAPSIVDCVTRRNGM